MFSSDRLARPTGALEMMLIVWSQDLLWRAGATTEAYIGSEQWELATQGSEGPSRESGNSDMPPSQGVTTTKLDYSTHICNKNITGWGTAKSSLSAGGPCLWELRGLSLLPHLSSSRPGTYLNQHGRDTVHKRKMHCFDFKKNILATVINLMLRYFPYHAI